jgi:hypothetical protein
MLSNRFKFFVKGILLKLNQTGLTGSSGLTKLEQALVAFNFYNR